MSLNDIKEQMLNFKNRIMLKVKAFEDIARVINSIYVIICKFFLLKQTLYELLKFEDKMVREDNPFGFNQWESFTKTQTYLKILETVSNQKYRVYNILDNLLYKTRAVMKASNINFSKEFNQYINDDPYQKPWPVLELLLQGTLKNMFQSIKDEMNLDKKALKIKFAILVQIVLYTEESGVFENIPKELEYATIYKQVEKSNDLKYLMQSFTDIIGKKTN